MSPLTSNSVFAFVILHYLDSEVTVTSVNSILASYGSRDIHVVIVDNASPDGSGELLAQRYKEESKVQVLLLNENLGFAKGNNAGYKFAVEGFDPDFIVILNSDVIISQSDFLDIVVDLYARTGFAVLGPDVWVPSLRLHQSPKRMSSTSAEEALAEAEKLERCIRMGRVQRLRVLLKRSAIAESTVLNLRRMKAGFRWDKECEGVVVHGSCFIVSRKFIQARPLALNPRTHMYFEMEILELECCQQGLKVLYSPLLKVEHRHSATVKAAYPDAVKRQCFMYRHMIDSLRVLADVAGAETGRLSSREE